MKELDFGKMEQELQKYMNTITDKGEEYPSWFGGTSYRNGIITFYVLKETTKDIKNKIESIIPNVVFKEAKVSKQTLYHCFKQINNKLSSKDVKKMCKENGFAYFFVDDEHGNITIGVEALTQKKEEIFKKIFFDIKDYLQFEEGSIPTKEEAAGSGFINNNEEYASYGFPATHPIHHEGFVITTHGEGNINDNVNDSAQVPMGKIALMQFSMSVDAAFATYNDYRNKTISPETEHSKHHMKYTITFIFLKPPVTMDGGTSHESNGQMLSNFAGGIDYTDFYMCDYVSDTGDSGGPITVGSYLLGIHIAGVHISEETPVIHRTFSCKYENISQALQITLDPRL